MGELVKRILIVLIIIRSAKFLHNKLLYCVLRSQLRFFETTPVGRILNRFSKDMAIIENNLPWSLRHVLTSLFDLISAAIIISTSTPIFVLVLVPIVLVYILIQVNMSKFRAKTSLFIFLHFLKIQIEIHFYHLSLNF